MDVDALMELLRGSGQAPVQEPVSNALTGALVVRVERASNLKAMDTNGRSDPYVVLKAGDKVIGKSKTIFRTLNPVWNERIECNISALSELLVQVYDHDRFSHDDLCGEVVLPLTLQGDCGYNMSDGDKRDLSLQLSPQVRRALFLVVVFSSKTI